MMKFSENVIFLEFLRNAGFSKDKFVT